MSTATVVDLNNQTLTFIGQQDFPQAIESSTRALEICMSLLSVAVWGASGPINECLDHCILRSPAEHSASNSQTTFIYKQGVSIPRDTTDLRMFAPILVFNAALPHQLLAIQHQHRQTSNHTASSLLQKAKRLYQLAHSQADLVLDVNVLFHFVVINNIAVIDRDLGRTLISKASFYYLQARYLIMMHQGQSERLRRLQGFWKNLLPPEASSSTRTPASTSNVQEVDE